MSNRLNEELGVCYCSCKGCKGQPSKHCRRGECYALTKPPCLPFETFWRLDGCPVVLV